MGKREDEKSSLDEISDITSRQNDIDIDMDLEELSLNLSMFVKAVYILSKFIQIYITRSIFDWSHKIKDKDSLNRLLYIVYNGVSNLQIEMADVVKHSLQSLEFEMSVSFDFSKVLRQAMNEQNDLEEIFEYYRLVEKYLLLDLEDEVKPLNYFSRITKDLPQDQDNLPLDKMLRISPLDWNTEYLKEYFDPEEYYAEKLQEEANL